MSTFYHRFFRDTKPNTGSMELKGNNFMKIKKNIYIFRLKFALTSSIRVGPITTLTNFVIKDNRQTAASWVKQVGKAESCNFPTEYIAVAQNFIFP